MKIENLKNKFENENVFFDIQIKFKIEKNKLFNTKKFFSILKVSFKENDKDKIFNQLIPENINMKYKTNYDGTESLYFYFQENINDGIKSLKRINYLNSL